MALINGDPLTHIKDLANVESVIKNGKLYRVSDLISPSFPALPLANNYLDGTFNPPVVSKLLLPDGVSSYTFLYTSTASLRR